MRYPLAQAKKALILTDNKTKKEAESIRFFGEIFRNNFIEIMWVVPIAPNHTDENSVPHIKEAEYPKRFAL